MDKYFWAELLIPIFCLGGLWLIMQSFFRKLIVRGYLWSLVFSILSLFLMAFVWIYVSRYSNHLQCVAAYGEMASDSKMCDNPAGGFVVMVQMPFLLMAWMAISIFSFLKLRSLRTKSAIT